MRITSIVVPVDFLEDSSYAARFARAIATRHRSRMTLVHVDTQLSSSASPSYLERRNEELARRLRDFAARSRLTGPLDLVVGRGDVAESIRLLVMSHPYELLVMAAGNDGCEHFVEGSVRSQIARSATCPILVARPDLQIPAWQHPFCRPVICIHNQHLHDNSRTLALTMSLTQAGASIRLLYVRGPPRTARTFRRGSWRCWNGTTKPDGDSDNLPVDSRGPGSGRPYAVKRATSCPARCAAWNATDMTWWWFRPTPSNTFGVPQLSQWAVCSTSVRVRSSSSRRSGALRTPGSFQGLPKLGASEANEWFRMGELWLINPSLRGGLTFSAVFASYRRYTVQP